MKNVKKSIRPAIVLVLILTIICGVIYPFFITGVSSVIFPQKANGDIIEVQLKDGTKKAYGMKNIGQEFQDEKYLIGRPQGVSNLSPVSSEYKEVIAERESWWQALDPQNTKQIPAELLTQSGSGVDPHISVDAANYQVERIAKVRKMTVGDVQAIIDKYTEDTLFGLFGDKKVNVLSVNLALDDLI